MKAYKKNKHLNTKGNFPGLLNRKISFTVSNNSFRHPKYYQLKVHQNYSINKALKIKLVTAKLPVLPSTKSPITDAGRPPIH